MEIVMNNLPPYLRNQKSIRSVCLILEGFEEHYYFKRLIELPIFSSNYKIKIINAKSAGNIPAKYQEALASDSYSVVLVVCDFDRRPDAYIGVVRGIENIIGDGCADKIITFTRPCTLQVILYHFGDAELTTQAKPAAREDVFRLAGIEHYDAHQNQLEEICRKIFLKSWNGMIKRLEQLSTDSDDIPSSNMIILFERLTSDDISWINEVNNSVFG
jgi:hypothetical protein